MQCALENHPFKAGKTLAVFTIVNAQWGSPRQCLMRTHVSFSLKQAFSGCVVCPSSRMYYHPMNERWFSLRPLSHRPPYRLHPLRHRWTRRC